MTEARDSSEASPEVLNATDESAPSEETTGSGPTGVGGWLAWLTFTLLILAPAMGLTRINDDFTSAEAQDAGLRTLRPWVNFKAATWLTFLGIAVTSVYAGWGLLQGRDWSVVRRAKIALWIVGPASHVVMGLVVPNVTLGSIEGFDGDQLVAPFIRAFSISVVVAALWTMYLSTSRRVRSTYGIPEANPEISSSENGGALPSISVSTGVGSSGISELEAEWQGKTDEQLLDAVTCLEDYTAEAQRVIQAEVLRRSIVEPAERAITFGEANAMARLYRRFVWLLAVQWLALFLLMFGRVNGSGVVVFFLLACVGAFIVASVALPITGYQLLKQLEVESPGRSAILMYMPLFSLLSLGAISSFARTWSRRYRVEVGFLGPTKEAMQRLPFSEY